jgi:hypothetical protein
MMQNRRGPTASSITANHALLTGAWTMDVKSLEAALGRVKLDAAMTSPCRVTFFEVAGDGDLHVNVMHRAATEGVTGWQGPAAAADGVVYNRTFSRMPRYQVLRQIKSMIFAGVPS